MKQIYRFLSHLTFGKTQYKLKYLYHKNDNDYYTKCTNDIQSLKESLSRIEKALLYLITPKNELVYDTQIKTLELLKKLQNICDKNSIDFWLQGGALLGAARHGAFIPWDDDADCGMLRQDVEKLEKILKNDKEYKIINCYGINKKNGWVWRMKKFIKKSDPAIFIDVFVYDLIDINCDEEKDVWALYQNQQKNMKDAIIKLGIENEDCELSDKKQEQEISQIMEEYIKLYKNDSGNSILFGIEQITSNFMRLYNKDIIFPLRKIFFCGHYFTVPNKTFEFLSRQYGDIYRLPYDIGVSHHILTDFSYVHHLQKNCDKGKKND